MTTHRFARTLRVALPGAALVAVLVTTACTAAVPQASSGVLDTSRPTAGAAAGPTSAALGPASPGTTADSGGSPDASSPPSEAAGAAAPTTIEAPSTTVTSPPPMPADGAASAATPGDLPAVVAAARASLSQVTQLHDLAVSTQHPDSIPPGVIGSSATNLATGFRAEAATATALNPGADQPSAKLAAALGQYAALADQLAGWDPAGHAPVADSFVTTIKQVDDGWTAAMTSLGGQAGQDLLTGMAPMLYPTA